MADIVCLGEILLRFAPPKYERLRQARTLNVVTVGSQLNVAAGFAQMGKHAVMLTQLPESEIGILAKMAAQGTGVDMAHVRLIPNTRMGTFYMEFTSTPRVGSLVYDRKHSAASMITPDDFAWDALLQGAKIAYSDGIFPGLSESCRAASVAFYQAAKRKGCLTAFDVNFREHLWTNDAARAAWSALLPLVDVVITSQGVTQGIFGFSGTADETATWYQREFGSRIVVVTHREIPSIERGAWSSIALADGAFVQGKRFDFTIVDRIGTGDAFCAGLLFGLLESGIEYGLNFGNALCALAHTIEGDTALVSRAEVDALLRDDYHLRIKR
ncbi:MAG: sugar kinase [bacterium]|nr:sugar kinase [bacterium]